MEFKIFIPYLVILLIVFLALRQINLWYWKINEIVDLLSDIRNALLPQKELSEFATPASLQEPTEKNGSEDESQDVRIAESDFIRVAEQYFNDWDRRSPLAEWIRVRRPGRRKLNKIAEGVGIDRDSIARMTYSNLLESIATRLER